MTATAGILEVWSRVQARKRAGQQIWWFGMCRAFLYLTGLKGCTVCTSYKALRHPPLTNLVSRGAVLVSRGAVLVSGGCPCFEGGCFCFEGVCPCFEGFRRTEEEPHRLPLVRPPILACRWVR
eukprot:365795-Chlamydomonas_euryale.AAC.5